MMLATMPPRHGIQRFEVVGELGSGASGVVYRARDPQLQRDVAIKLLERPVEQVRRELPQTDTLDLRGTEPSGELLSEARMMARLSHPNILPVYEVGLEGTEVFVVMELIAGPDLRTWLETPRTQREILDVFAQAGRGLLGAHERGIVHRDFKPANVLVGEDGRVRVADFGLSQLATRRAQLRVEPAIGGTPAYMAPELWRGGDATERSDTFAFCTALAEAVGGSDKLPPALRTLVAAGCAAEPSARPPLAAIVAACAPRARRSRLGIVLAAAALLAGGTAVALFALRGPAPCAADDVITAGWESDRRAALIPNLRRVCEAEQAGDLAHDQARGRVACLERRAIELEVIARLPVAEQRAALEDIPIDTCDTLDAPPLARDHATLVALYTRLVATERTTTASAERARQLASLEHDAHDAGERELEARAALWLGMRQIEAEDLTGADASLARAYDQGVALHSSSSPATALVERSIAATMRKDGAAATTFGKLALELADKPSADPQVRAAVYYAVGIAYGERGELAHALEVLRKGLAVIAADGHRQDAREVSVRMALIDTLETIGGHDTEALELALSTLELERKVDGEHHPDYGIALNIVAIAYRYNDDVQHALAYRRRALAVMQETMPADSAMVLAERSDLAADLFGSGAYEAARKELADLLAVKSSNEKWLAIRPRMLADFGVFTFATGDTAEGMRLFAQGVDDLSAQKGPVHPDVLDYRLQQCELELELGRIADADHHADDLARRASTRTDRPLDRPRLDARVRARLALAHHTPELAEQLARGALSAYTELRASESEREVALAALAESLVDQRRFADALDIIEQATAIDRAHHALDDRLAQLDLQRARALAGLGRVAEARAALTAARAVLDRFPGDVRARALAASLRW